MMMESAIASIDRQDWLERTAGAVQPLVTNTFRAGGMAGQKLKNLLHGVWLGHPLHPALTDVPIGAWTVALVFDVMTENNGRRECSRAAETAVAVGLAGAAAAAVAGLTDWSDTNGRARRIGMMHGLLNVGATALYGASLWLRRRARHRAGRNLAYAGYAVSMASAYLGGHMISGEQVGVNHTAAQRLPRAFTPVMPERDLPEGELRRAEADGVPVLLVRCGGEIYALAETCAHMGGPLAEGDLIDGSVRCPWHGSRYRLEDGRVLDGPSTFSQPCFETRLRDGQIEVRAASGVCG
ncbi:MAG TPA: Rieske 2Fe-2S domain-containing protein [Blastocatellia bacterium]|nr:Rieske 2Fe-2S domain-containing protein [Blastocatellia bacterium]